MGRLFPDPFQLFFRIHRLLWRCIFSGFAWLFRVKSRSLAMMMRPGKNGLRH